MEMEKIVLGFIIVGCVAVGVFEGIAIDVEHGCHFGKIMATGFIIIVIAICYAISRDNFLKSRGEG